MTVINTNIAASITANSMKNNQRAMETSMERLSTGKRINSASDDAAGLGIETRMTSQIKGLETASRSANDGISLLQTADGAIAAMGDMFQRMRELAVQAQSGTLLAADKTNLNQEFAALASEIDRIATDTTFNNKAILGADKGGVNIMVGADEADIVTFTTKDMQLSVTGTWTTDISSFKAAGGTFDVETAAVIGHIDVAITAVAAERASIGATVNRLEYAVENLNQSVVNAKSARSQITDADYAAETTELARTQIIAQASTAMLSQANQQAQSVLALLK